MVTLSTSSDAFDAVRRARSVVAAAYLAPFGRFLAALEQAARRGASVTVRLEGRPFGDAAGTLHRKNAAAVAALRSLGVHASLADRGEGRGPALHMKAVVCDGVAYLDDRNFTGSGRETVLRDDNPADVQNVLAAARGKPAAHTRACWTTKAQSLRGEGNMLARAMHAKAVEVESESFGSCTPVFRQLLRLAQRGVRCRLLVARRDISARNAHALRKLEDAGVKVRAGDANEKMAIVDRARAWIGSANATSVFFDGDQIDWGLCTRSSAVVNGLRAQFDSQWADSRRL